MINVDLLNIKARRFVDEYFYEIDNMYSISDFLSNSNYLIHSQVSYDGTPIEAIEVNNNNSSNKYIFMLHGLKQNINDLEDIAIGFNDFGYNFVFLNNRRQLTYGIKESIDLIYWIRYFYNIYPNIEIFLYGEFEGANAIIRSLNSKMPPCVKSAILDSPSCGLMDDLLHEFNEKNKTDNIIGLKNGINSILQKRFNIRLFDMFLDDSLNKNILPLCFVYSKNVNKKKYYDILKIYNKTKGIKKFFYTNCTDRNFKEKNFFEVLHCFQKKL